MTVEYTVQEVGLLSLIAAMYADKVLSSPSTDASLKAVALKAKSNVTMRPVGEDSIYYQTGKYSVVCNHHRGWTLEIG